jgi:hypothetical protein
MRVGKVARSAGGRRHYRTNLALGTLFVGAFVVGSTELVVVARGMDVSIGAPGTLVTA